MSIRRGLAASLLAGTMLIGTAGVALGHECVISSRSAQGDAGALHSGRWVRLSLADVYGFINEAVGGPALTASQIEWAVGESIEAGATRRMAGSFVVTRPSARARRTGTWPTARASITSKTWSARRSSASTSRRSSTDRSGSLGRPPSRSARRPPTCHHRRITKLGAADVLSVRHPRLPRPPRRHPRLVAGGSVALEPGLRQLPGPLLGFIFLPWVTLAYVLVFPGGVEGFDWVWLGLALLIDLSSWFGGGYTNRNRLPAAVRRAAPDGVTRRSRPGRGHLG